MKRRAARTIEMTYEQEQAIKRWLRHIGESDHELISETIKDCRENNDSLEYYLDRAATMPDKKQKKPQRPKHRRYNPPFIDLASDDTHQAEMQKIRERLPCRRR